MSWAQKIRTMMMQAAPAPTNAIVPNSWTLKYWINTSGQVVEGNNAKFSATSSAVAARTGGTIKRTGVQTDQNGNNISMFVHQYANGTWKRRSSNLSVGSTVTLNNDCTEFVIVFQYGSTSGLTMGNEVIAYAYGAEWVV